MPVFLITAPLLLARLAIRQSPVLNGRVEAYLTDLGPRVAGRLTVLNVQEGQRVKQGDLLARIAAEELDAAVIRDEAAFQSVDAKRLEFANGTRPEDIAQGQARVHDAEAALRLTDDTLRRAQSLLAEKIVSQADLDKTQTERERAYAHLVLQQKTLAELKAGARAEQRQGASAAHGAPRRPWTRPSTGLFHGDPRAF